MNLVVKEYLASQDPEDPGMPVLSCFAGAAHELGEAIIVNPNDLEGMAEAILQGLDMPVGERKERWNAMMTTLRRNDAECLAPALRRGAGRRSRAVMAGTGQRGAGDATWLVGDIGATNARFGLVAPGRGDAAFEHLRLRRFRDNRRRDPGLSRQRGDLPMPRIGALAIAAAITGDQIRMTNHPWSFSVDGVARPARLRAARRDQRFHRGGAGPAAARRGRPDAGRRRRAGRGRTIAVLGPGSGLGASGLVPMGRATPDGSR